ncbi:GNAT family N-acetyltransferase [Georgenia subflava]|uniref:GNAT family N-acetyltransferase n=1 Tax=Georgenia subflava TaxID=1622177 RepID=A0A6N7ERF4_9MICO|nr:GNAT family N-acetyltransferase [Georgenia subflava]MPV38686.1 GNAT family N-acetyltransferase [Georgenia subflava]
MTSADDLDPDDVLGSLMRGTGAGPGSSPGGIDPHAGHDHGDPHAGHDHADPHAGHGHGDPLRPSADLSVRPAVAEDAAELGNLHARTLRASLAAGTGAELDPVVASMIDPVELGRSWSSAITAAPSPQHRVLTALAGAQVVGFAAIAPAEVAVDVRAAEPDGGATGAIDDGGAPGTTDGGEPGAADAVQPGTTSPGTAGADDAGSVGEILALEVPAAFGRRGHGSRLLAACVDLLRDQGVRRVQTWAVQGDDARTRFLSQAGFAPAGLRRTLDVGGHELVETCWYAEI